MFSVYHIFRSGEPDRVLSPRRMESEYPEVKRALDRSRKDTVKIKWGSGRKMIVTKAARSDFDEAIIE